MELGGVGWVFTIHQLKNTFKNMLPLFLYSPTKGVIKKRVTYYPTLIPSFTYDLIHSKTCYPF